MTRSHAEWIKSFSGRSLVTTKIALCKLNTSGSVIVMAWNDTVRIGILSNEAKKEYARDVINEKQSISLEYTVIDVNDILDSIDWPLMVCDDIFRS